MMLRRSLSLLLCAVFAFSLCTFALPETALAAENSGVWVGGTDVTAGGYWLNDNSTGGITGVNATADSYNVRYEASTSTLTLKDATISKYTAGLSVPETGDSSTIYAAVYAAVSLTVKLDGSNTLTVSGDPSTTSSSAIGIYVPAVNLTINGNGSLTTSGSDSLNGGSSYGINVKGNININGATITANGASASNHSSGIRADNIISINGATITTAGGSGKVSCGLYSSTANISITNTKLTATGATATDISAGICLNSASSTLSISGGNVTANCGSAPNGGGIYFVNRDIVLSITNNATVIAHAVSSSQLSSIASGKPSVPPDPQIQISDYPNGFAVSTDADFDPNDAVYDSSYISNYIDEASQVIKVAPISAAIGNVTVSGTKGKAIAVQSATITLTNNAFNRIIKSTETVSNWFPNMPAGLTAKIDSQVPVGSSTATVTFSGTPTATSNAAMNIIIPANDLASAHDLTVATSTNAKWNISAPAPSATIGDVTVSGTKGKAIAVQSATITLTNNAFKALATGADVSGWFTNIPGITAKIASAVAVNSGTATVNFSGTPTEISNAAMAVTIPANNLASAHDLTVATNTNAKWSISAPSSGGSSSSGSSGSSSSTVTVYNAPSPSAATIKLSGNGLTSNDLLITERNPQGSAYNALLRLANGGDVFNTYNISLRSGKKSTGSAMNLTFDLDSKYAGQSFTLVHQKADGSYEYFYATADYFGDLSFGPLYELSPFMLVQGKLAQTAYTSFTDMPKTGDNAKVALWTSVVLLMAAASLAGVALRKRHD